jgi:hypothetical protein
LHRTLTEQGMASPCVLVIGDVLRGLASLRQAPESLNLGTRVQAV